MPKETFEEYVAERFPDNKGVITFIYRDLLPTILKPLYNKIGVLEAEKDALKARLPSAIVDIDSVGKFIGEHEYAIVDFFSTYCVPCYQLEPALEKVAGEDNGVAIGRINLDENRDTVKKYDVSAIPLLISFRNGSMVQRLTGAPNDEVGRMHRVKWMSHRLKIPDEAYNKMYAIVENVAKTKGWYLNPNKDLVNGLVSALAFERQRNNPPYCPCKPKKVKENICPCRESEDWPGVEKRLEQEKKCCYCGLFCHKDYVEKYEKEREKMTFREGK